MRIGNDGSSSFSSGELIKDLRKGMKKSQTWLAEKTGLSLSSIRRYESDERVPNASDLCAIAEALHADITDIMPDSNNLQSRRKNGKNYDSFIEYLKKLKIEVIWTEDEEGFLTGFLLIYDDIAEGRTYRKQLSNNEFNLFYEKVSALILTEVKYPGLGTREVYQLFNEKNRIE